MNINQALAVVEEASGEVKANRAVHIKIQEALMVLRKFIEEKPLTDKEK